MFVPWSLFNKEHSRVFSKNWVDCSFCVCTTLFAVIKLRGKLVMAYHAEACMAVCSWGTTTSYETHWRRSNWLRSSLEDMTGRVALPVIGRSTANCRKLGGAVRHRVTPVPRDKKHRPHLGKGPWYAVEEDVHITTTTFKLLATVRWVISLPG